MKVYLAGENGKAKILRLYDSIFGKRGIENTMQAVSRAKTDRQTEPMNIYLAGGLSWNLSPYYQAIASKQASA